MLNFLKFMSLVFIAASFYYKAVMDEKNEEAPVWLWRSDYIMAGVWLGFSFVVFSQGGNV